MGSLEFPLTREAAESLMYVVPAVAIVLTVAYATLRGRPAPFARGFLAASLLATTALALVNYGSVQWRIRNYFNEYEFFHYYLGSKYAAEVGYTGLYETALVANAELGVGRLPPTIRDLATGRFVASRSVIARASEIKGRFSPERWNEFTADVWYFRSQVPLSQWFRMLRDKGYNATPSWTAISGVLANAVPTSNAPGMTFLACLDLLLLGGAAAAVCWAFGARTMLFLLTLLGTHMLMSHNHMKAAFLRTDWVAALLVAVCMLRMGWYKTAGALTAYAAMSRVFPIVFAFGVAAKLASGWWRTRTVPRHEVEYFVALGAVVGVLLVVSVIHAGGIGPWIEFVEKIARHDRGLAPWRVGFKYVWLMTDWKPGPDGSGAFEEQRLAWWTIQVLVLGGCFVLAGKLEDYEAMAFSYVPMFFLFAPTYYYHVVLLVAAMFFLPKLEEPTRAAGVVLLFAGSIVSQWLYVLWDRTAMLFFVISCVLLLQVAYTVGVVVADLLRRGAGEDAVEPRGVEAGHAG
jgi:hypothetical protein